MKNLIYEIYTCVQGEGKLIGTPHILVRLVGCNLTCQFKDTICDTSYLSWNPLTKGIYDLTDVMKVIKHNPQIRHLLITGGEPGLHPTFLRMIIEAVTFGGMEVTIETNGTKRMPSFGRMVTLSISPKLASSIPREGTMVKVQNGRGGEYEKIVTKEIRLQHINNYCRPEVLEYLIAKYSYYLKFVVSSEQDIIEIKDMQHSLGIHSSKIYLMPEGTTPEQLEKKRPWLIEVCIREGYNYSDRLHILAYGGGQGV